MPERKGQGLQERVDARRFDQADVRELLDELRLDELELKYGPPAVTVAYAKPRGYWSPGDGRPALADDDPAVMQLIGRCMAHRLREQLPVPAPRSRGQVHPEACAWCEYPDDALLAALDWSTWSARFIASELLIWRNRDDPNVVYIRQGERTGTYTNPAHAEFWALPVKRRGERLAQLTLGMAA